jgi:GT2 family glycosyltransferase
MTESGSQGSSSVPHVQVVIPSWNGADLLPRILGSLDRQTYSYFSVIVVDNGSTDDSVTVVRHRWPEVSIVKLPKNTGFAHATNRGILAGTAELLALVNNDVDLDPRWIAEMVAALTAHPGAGSATGRMLSAREPSMLDNVGLYCHWDGTSGPAARGAYDGPQFNRPGDVFGACAGAGMYRRVAFESVGYFDEDFFAYVEDADWSFRAQLCGFPCRYVPTAISYHLSGSTSVRLGRRTSYLATRNSAVMIIKNFPGWALLRYWPRILWQFTSLAKRSVGQGWFRTYCAALVRVARSLPGILRQRRAIQRSSTVARTQLESVVGGVRPLRSSVALAMRGRQ